MRGPLVSLLVLAALLIGAPSAAGAQRPCGLVPLRATESVVVTSLSAPCRAARRVAKRWAHKASCRDNRCRVKSWTCTPRGPRSRCTRAGQAFEVQRRFVIVDAAAASAIGGGTYTGDVDAPCDRACKVRLVVVDDGRSLASSSIVAAPCGIAETPSADSENAPRGTRIKADGSFRWRTRFQVVEGTFDGRSVTGSTRFLGRARTDCSEATVTFSASLKRRSKSKGTCEPLEKGMLEVSVFARRTGCTVATRVVDAWRADRDCISTSLQRSSCRVAGRTCTPVIGGQLANLAGVACIAGRSRIELVLRQACGGRGPAFGWTSSAINLSCREAQRVTATWAEAGCGRKRCTVLGYRCAGSAGNGPYSRCRRGALGVDIWRQVLVFD